MDDKPTIGHIAFGPSLPFEPSLPVPTLVSDRLRAKDAEIATLRAQLADAERLRAEEGARHGDAMAFIERRGYRSCDIPACNCGSWHGGNAEQRLHEIHDALVDALGDVGSHTALSAIGSLVTERDALAERVRAMEDCIDSLANDDCSNCTDGSRCGRCTSCRARNFRNYLARPETTGDARHEGGRDE